MDELNRTSREAPNEAQASPPTRDADQTPALDWQTLLDRCLGKKTLARRLLVTFVSELPASVARINATAAAEDWDELRRLAHQLKGGAGNLSADRIMRTASRLEEVAAEGCHAEAASLVTCLRDEADQLADNIFRLVPDLWTQCGERG